MSVGAVQASALNFSTEDSSVELLRAGAPRWGRWRHFFSPILVH
jgi:hypothetical protein